MRRCARLPLPRRYAVHEVRPHHEDIAATCYVGRLDPVPRGRVAVPVPIGVQPFGQLFGAGAG